MGVTTGKVLEIRLGPGGKSSAWIACPGKIIPGPGQYLLAVDEEAYLPVPLFTCETSEQGFLAASPLPPSWAPGIRLRLLGPLGRGFHLPSTTKNLALVALGDTLTRLLSLAAQALAHDLAIAVFTDAPLPALPLSVEVHPLLALSEALSWADFLAVDLPVAGLPALRQSLGLPPGRPLPCPAEGLVYTLMPCGGLAECGVCAVKARRSWKLACKDGPVFNLQELEW